MNVSIDHEIAERALRIRTVVGCHGSQELWGFSVDEEQISDAAWSQGEFIRRLFQYVRGGFFLADDNPELEFDTGGVADLYRLAGAM